MTNHMEAKPVRVDEVGFHRVTACVTNTAESNIHNVWEPLYRDPCTAPIVKFIDGNCQRPTLRASGLCQCIKSEVVQQRRAPCKPINKFSSVSALGTTPAATPRAPSYELAQGKRTRIFCVSCKVLSAVVPAPRGGHHTTQIKMVPCSSCGSGDSLRSPRWCCPSRTPRNSSQ